MVCEVDTAQLHHRSAALESCGVNFRGNRLDAGRRLIRPIQAAAISYPLPWRSQMEGRIGGPDATIPFGSSGRFEMNWGRRK